MYDNAMGYVTQVGFQLDDESLAALDALASRDSISRAEILRTAVRDFLARRREDDIDARLAAGYRDVPAGGEEAQLAELSLDGLRAAQLDW